MEDLKTVYRSMYSIAKNLDEQKAFIKTIPELFSAELVSQRDQLLTQCEDLLLEDFETIGRKSRDVLWRKGYYDLISTAKKFWKATRDHLSDEEIANLVNFIQAGIGQYKKLILELEDKFSLDLRYIIDFDLIKSGVEWKPAEISQREIYTIHENSYALESIHCFLIVLGDLHRYFVEFNFANSEITKITAANFYIEAFKLNPKNGMPHNQLGTLYAGQSYDVDSVYHYLYSLISPVPFDLSENNVTRIFQINSDFLEKYGNEENDGEFSVKAFVAQMLLMVDIFFYDKDVVDFNNLCHSVLIDFKIYLTKLHKHGYQSNDSIFKMTSILIFCLLKLQISKSPKVAFLNAFLVAFINELVDLCLSHMDSFLDDNKEENKKFASDYHKRYLLFDTKIKQVKENRDGKLVKEKPKILRKRADDILPSSDKKSLGGLSGKSSNNSSVSKSSPQSAEASAPEKPTNKKKMLASRRRRKRQGSDSEIESEDESSRDGSLSGNESDQSMNSDFESYDEANNDDSDAGSDGPDIVVEKEELVYSNNNKSVSKQHQQVDYFNSNGFVRTDDESEISEFVSKEDFSDGNEDFIIEEERIIFNGEEEETENAKVLESAESLEKIFKMKYKKLYSKASPNLIIKFEKLFEGALKSLKVLFDWLRLNQEILIGCYQSNPELIHKIMKLINFLNIDIFTRKIYFERELLTIPNVREDLRYLFDIRGTIPVSEDISFKHLLLFEDYQNYLDWETTYKLQITDEEDTILRNFKIIDFGFHVCKMKSFNYNFCARGRSFIERVRGPRVRNRNRNRQNSRRKEKREEYREEPRRVRKPRREETTSKITIKRHSDDEKEEYVDTKEVNDVSEAPTNLRKGYLKSKEHIKKDKENNDQNGDEKVVLDSKHELMGKLWLRNEVQTLESKMKKPYSHQLELTPFLVVDSKCLTEHLYIVKNLVKSKKFFVLIPEAVLSDLDELKKQSEGARNAIKYLEGEFKKGNRFLRSQRSMETLPLPYKLKVPKKLDSYSLCFMQMAQFCNYIVSTNTDNSSADIVTLLVGDNWEEKKKQSSLDNSNLCLAGIIQSISVRAENVQQFYAKYKKK